MIHVTRRVKVVINGKSGILETKINRSLGKCLILAIGVAILDLTEVFGPVDIGPIPGLLPLVFAFLFGASIEKYWLAVNLDYGKVQISRFAHFFYSTREFPLSELNDIRFEIRSQKVLNISLRQIVFWRIVVETYTETILLNWWGSGVGSKNDLDKELIEMFRKWLFFNYKFI